MMCSAGIVVSGAAGAVPRKGVYDGEPGISTRRDGRVYFAEAFLAFKGASGMGRDRAATWASGTQGHRGTRQRLPGDQLLAGADVHER